MTHHPKNLRSIVESRMCTGCGGCAVASLNAKLMEATRDENHRPNFDGNRGVAKNIRSRKACPALSNRKTSGFKSKMEAAFGRVVAVYEGYAADSLIRFRGSSGGAVTALALASLDSRAGGVLHVKPGQKSPALNEAAISRSREDLLAGTGSRYAPASVLPGLISDRDNADRLTVIGKPCDIEGADKLSGVSAVLDAKIALKISILCAGVPSHEGTGALLDYLATEANFGPGRYKLKRVDYRGKGWPGNMRATWRGRFGQKVSAETDYKTGWGDILQKYRQWRCHLCTDHTGELADISVGDPWHTPVSDDSDGRSLILVRTERGQKALQEAIDNGHLVAERVDPKTLFEAQPNLVAAKGAAFGRALALKLIGLKAPALRADSFKLWRGLTLREKLQSIAGTWKRVLKRQLYRKKQVDWLTPQ